MSGWATALSWLGLFVGLHVLVVVVILLERVHRPLREIKRYADDTLAAGLGITRHLDAVDETARTQELVGELAKELR